MPTMEVGCVCVFQPNMQAKSKILTICMPTVGVGCKVIRSRPLFKIDWQKQLTILTNAFGGLSVDEGVVCHHL